jgi:hypothetical protein
MRFNFRYATTLPYALVERLAAEAILLRELRSALPGGSPLAQLLGSVSTELRFAPLVLACCFGDGNPLTLSFQDQGCSSRGGLKTLYSLLICFRMRVRVELFSK